MCGSSKKQDARTWFPYYAEWAQQLLGIPADLRIRIDDAIKRYVLYGEEPQDREVLYSMFALMRAQIDRDRETYNRRCSQNADNVRKRWSKTDDTNVYDRIRTNTTATNKKYKEKENIYKKLSNESKKDAAERRAFVAPSLEDVKEYFSTIGGDYSEAERFIDYYTSNGWKVGRNPMKDWKAAARNWNKKAKSMSNTTSTSTKNEISIQYPVF